MSCTLQVGKGFMGGQAHHFISPTPCPNSMGYLEGRWGSEPGTLKMCSSSSRIWNEGVSPVWTDYHKLWKQPGLWQRQTQQCQDDNGLMKCSCRKQPRPLGFQLMSQQPWLLLLTHHKIVRVWNFGDIWSFNLIKTAFGISLPSMELFLGIFQTCM